MTFDRRLDLLADHHVHSTFSDDAQSTLAENVSAARALGLRELRLVDHVRTSTTWVPEFLGAVAALDRLADAGPVAVLSGVEAKILDARGTLDLPPEIATGMLRVGRILIADHQYPGIDGPLSPGTVLERRAAGWAASDVLDGLVHATILAMKSVDNAQLAHLFSLLPKIGLTEDDLDDDHLTTLASAAAATGTAVEVNEKWGCPGPRALRVMREVGVRLVASTDSHQCGDVGRYRRVVALADEAGLGTIPGDKESTPAPWSDPISGDRLDNRAGQVADPASR